MGVNNIYEIVACVKEELDELKAKSQLTETEYGQLLAYAETLSIIQSACAGYDLEQIGLNFDIDATYLI